MYQNYHKHDYYSNIILADSVVSPEDYAKRAVELGHSILSSCNHGTAGAYRQCADLAAKYGLRWRYVAETYFVKDRLAEDADGRRDRKNAHIILAAKTEKGIGDLNEVLSEANISGYYFRPRVDMELLLRLDPRDVFVTTACVGGIWTYGYAVDKPQEVVSLEKENKEIWDLVMAAEDPRGGYLDKITIKNIAHKHKDQELLELSETFEWQPIKAKLLAIREQNFAIVKRQTALHYRWDEPDKIVKQLAGHFGDSFMLEVQYHQSEKQKAVNAHILELYRQLGIPLIAGMDSHFIYPEEAELRNMRLEANHIVYEDEGGWYMDYPSDEEAYRRFEEQGVLSAAQIREAMENTNVFLTFDDVTLDKGRKLPTIYPNLTQEERNEKYRQLVTSKWEEYKKQVPPERWPEYEAGIKYEVDTITSTNTSDYFLLDYEWIKHAKEMGGVLTKTGRGSAPSYFTNMLLGFSSIDRFAVPITMYPDRFISAERLKVGLPDIDMNVSDQGLFGQAMADVVGEWHCAPMVAFGTLKRLSAWKMYCRASNVPFDIANELSENLKAYELDVKHADEDEKDDINVLDYVPEKYHAYLKASEKYLGMVDSISPHPCAYLLCNNDIRREVGIFRINAKNGSKKIVYAAFIDGATADAYGYLKNDDLQVTVVKLNADIYRRIGIPQPSVPELLKMTDGDHATWDMYAKGLTLGLNQAEKEKSTEKVIRYRPRNISELSAFVAGIRPAFQSMINKLLNRETFSYGIPALDHLLQTKERPQSFILYQEQMMKVLQWAGFSAPDSYAAIKAIAKKHPEKVLPLKEKFLKGFSEKLIKEEGVAPDSAASTTDKVWTIISDACAYGFNSSHSISVALDSLYTAWAKAHYPYETYVSLLSNYAEKKDKDRIAKAKEEMLKGFGIRIVPCKFRQDNRSYFVDKDAHTISDALTSVKGISATAAKTLYQMRNNQYDTAVDLFYDLEVNTAINSAVITTLIKMGYFEEFGSSGKLLNLYDEFRNGDSKFSKAHVKTTQAKRLDALRQIERELPECTIPIPEQMKFEVEYYGTPLTTYPDQSGCFAILEVDDRYSPKVKMYNIAKGTVGVMKLKKALYNKKHFEVGDVIRLIGWKRKPAYQYSDGKQMVKPGVFDLWIEDYEIFAGV